MRIHVAGWRDNYRGLIPDASIDERTPEFRRAMWRELLGENRRVTLVAQSAPSTLAGFASARLLEEAHGGFDAFLEMLYVDTPCVRRGIGEALLRAMAGELRRGGGTALALRTLRLNPARGFYERLGARLVLGGFELEAGQLDDVVYGFDDLATL